MSETKQPMSTRQRWTVVGALVAVALLFVAAFFFSRLVGQATEGFLRAAGQLDVDAFYSGDDRRSLLALWPYWALAAAYTAPLAAAVLRGTSIVSRRDRRAGAARALDVTAFVVAALWTFGVISFAFDPSRSGLHEPLIRRYEAFSYEAADLVFAATWTMVATAIVVLAATAFVSTTRARLVVAVSAFVVAGGLLALLFS